MEEGKGERERMKVSENERNKRGRERKGIKCRQRKKGGKNSIDKENLLEEKKGE